MDTGWLIGWMIGGGVVLIVAVLAVTLIVEARKIGSQAADILEALERARDNTAGLWEVDAVNRSLERSAGAAVAARSALSGDAR